MWCAAAFNQQRPYDIDVTSVQVNWATMHVENATDAYFKNFTWQNNIGASSFRIISTASGQTRSASHGQTICWLQLQVLLLRPKRPLSIWHLYVTGQRFPTLAGARSRISVDSCRFVNNTYGPRLMLPAYGLKLDVHDQRGDCPSLHVCRCTNNTRCHTPGIYVTEGERLTLTKSSCASRPSQPASCAGQCLHRI